MLACIVGDNKAFHLIRLAMLGTFPSRGRLEKTGRRTGVTIKILYHVSGFISPLAACTVQGFPSEGKLAPIGDR